ncbi:unnamed protein product [Spirodela intermedia]|uniref:CRM domain-containing protein n=1 Tax=Spirodela intermedia TaxID=51605 RepID=A0ABN7EBH4_SPIIN|nr:unnamed protein product [Spirodela intermedia]
MLSHKINSGIGNQRRLATTDLCQIILLKIQNMTLKSNLVYMLEDNERLTGGILLSRNKDYIVAEALMERERLAMVLQEEEEQARLQASSSVGKKLDDDHKNRMMRASEVARHAQLVRKLEKKLSVADRKLVKAERALGKVEEFLKPVEPRSDPESITDEERFMFRNLDLTSGKFLGRRGIFGGTVENMHLHWKYRELVKVIIKAKNFAESGGVLVSVDKISKGFAIIVYRGKDYHRPPSLRPKNLLTKRKALARSIELQRREALRRYISGLQKKVEQLKSELDQMEDARDRGDEDLYARLDAAYLTADEDSEDDDDAEAEGYGEDSEEELVDSFDSVLDDYSGQLIEASDDETYSKAVGKEEHHL